MRRFHGTAVGNNRCPTVVSNTPHDGRAGPRCKVRPIRSFTTPGKVHLQQACGADMGLDGYRNVTQRSKAKWDQAREKGANCAPKLRETFRTWMGAIDREGSRHGGRPAGTRRRKQGERGGSLHDEDMWQKLLKTMSFGFCEQDVSVCIYWRHK